MAAVDTVSCEANRKELHQRVNGKLSLSLFATLFVVFMLALSCTALMGWRASSRLDSHEALQEVNEWQTSKQLADIQLKVNKLYEAGIKSGAIKGVE